MRSFSVGLGLIALCTIGMQPAFAEMICGGGPDGSTVCRESDQSKAQERDERRQRYYRPAPPSYGGYYGAPRYYAPQPRRRSRDPNAGCPPYYTVQDGVCKPYRGY